MTLVADPIPYSVEVERALIGRMLTKPDTIGEILGHHVERDDFHTAECRLLFDRISEAHRSIDGIDPIVIGERARKPLSEIWGVPEAEVSSSLKALTASASAAGLLDAHVGELKSLSNRRQIIQAADRANIAAHSSETDPVRVAMELSDAMTEITVGKRKSKIVTRQENVERFYRELSLRKRIRDEGGDLGVFTGYNFFDTKMAGIQPGEVVMLAGEPGVGKSAIAQTLARGFAHRQLHKSMEHRIGTLVINLEMTPFVDMSRDVQMLTQIDGNRLRRAELGKDDFQRIAQAYVKDRFKELPLFANYASRLAASQIRAVVLDALSRGYNTGFVIIDHFRMFDLDRGTLPKDAGSTQVDEEKARFLKELAKDLNIGIMCLAHTVKMSRESDGRPGLSDLRGSYQVAAYCDVVSFVYQPYMYASPEERENNVVRETDAELIFAKNRNGRKGADSFYFDGQTMEVRDSWSV